MATTDHVNISISIDSVGIARRGFGIPLILSHNAAFGDRVRSYGSLSELTGDGFATTSPEYRAMAAYFAQTPRPPEVMIGRATSSVIQKYQISASAIRNTEAYVVTVDGEGMEDTDATYTSGASATVEQIHNGLLTAINAVASNNYLAEFAALVYADKTFTADNATEIFTSATHGLLTGDGPLQVSNSGGALPAGLATLTDYWVIKIDANTFYLATSLALALAGTHLLISTNGTGTQTISDTASTVRPSDPFTVTGDASGDWFSLEVYDPAALKIAQTHVVSGLATELDAIRQADDTWYELHTLYNSTDYVLDAAAWVETAEVTYVVDVNETDSITTTEGSGTDTLKQLFELGYARTMYGYHHSPAQMYAAAWMGRWLPTLPGKATPKFKTLSGITANKLNTTHRNNLIARRANSYQRVSGRNITWEGTVASDTYKFFDVVRNRDWLQDQVSASVFEMLAGAEIVPMTAEGTSMVQGAVSGPLNGIAITQGVLADDPAPIVTVPDIADVELVDKADRILRSVVGSGTLQGAVHKVFATISVTF